MSAPEIGAALVVIAGTDNYGKPVLRNVHVISTIANGIVGAWYERERWVSEGGRWRDMPLMLVDEGTIWAREGADTQSLLAAYALAKSIE